MKPSFKTTQKKKSFLGVRFDTCSCYGRLYINDEGTAYVGRCPRCYAPFAVRIGSHGTSKRLFVAHCG